MDFLPVDGFQSQDWADIMTDPGVNLGLAVRHYYTGIFKAKVSAGEARPLTIPYSVLGAFILPALWLCIPHTKRPWLYQARWVVLATCVGFNLKMMSETSSTNMAVSYAAGLLGYWGIMSTFSLLVWTRPQFDMARVMKRKKRHRRIANGSAHREDVHDVVANGHVGGESNRVDATVTRTENEKLVELKKKASSDDEPLKQDSDKYEDEYEYYWQHFPEDGSFLVRLSWVVDLLTNFRGSGWNWAISPVPNPPRPEKPHSGELVRMDAIPLTTSWGYSRYTTQGELVGSKIRAVVFSYLVLDFLSVFMMKDPYFIFGPTKLPLRPLLHSLHPWLLRLYRNVFVGAGIYTALLLIFSSHDLVQYFLVSRMLPIRAEMWQHTSIFGAFSQVLDRGLAGFWGGWWHQTFRFAFTSPAVWLVKQGYLTPRTKATKIITMTVAFGMSGLLHACGSWTSIPPTKLWRAPLFFLLQAVGVLVQEVLCDALHGQAKAMPHIVRRMGNLLFVFAWLYLTVGPFADDLSSTGLWMLEPVPISPLRFMGFGHLTDSWWRWDRDHWMRWCPGRHWWDSGIGG